jgi:hypothetical protein
MRGFASGPWPKLLLAALVLGSTGCEKMREVSACRRIADAANTALGDVEALSKKSGPEPQTMMAKRYAELAKELEPFAVGETPLALHVRDYVQLIRATDAALRNHAEATRSNNDARKNELRRELDRLVKRERAAVTRIDVACHT